MRSLTDGKLQFILLRIFLEKRSTLDSQAQIETPIEQAEGVEGDSAKQ